MPVRPKLGSVLQGTLEFAHGEPPLQVSGTVVRVGKSEIASTSPTIGPRLSATPHPPPLAPPAWPYLVARPMTALQDLYPEDFSHCYGCGRLNSHGLHVKSEWKDGEAVARFTPEPFHIAMPGFVYGGLIASLIDCHAMATAAGAFMQAAGQTPGTDQTPRFVTGSLQVDYKTPDSGRDRAGPHRPGGGDRRAQGDRRGVVQRRRERDSAGAAWSP